MTADAFILLPSAVENHPDVVGVKVCPNVWFQTEEWSRFRVLTRSPWDSESQVSVNHQDTGHWWTPAAPAESMTFNTQVFGPGGVSPWTSGGSLLGVFYHPSSSISGGVWTCPPTKGCVRFWMQNLSADCRISAS